MKKRLSAGPTIFFCIVSFLNPYAKPSQCSEATPQEKEIKKITELPLEELLKIQVVSVATGTLQPLNEAPAVATVITANDIQAMGATTLEEALEAVPGLHVSTGPGYTPLYAFRGIWTTLNPQTLVMINGIPITSLYRGDRNAHVPVIPVKMISRIEIIRGPGSALYGADAFAGVINIISKTSSDIHGTEVGGRIGSFDTRNAWFLHGATYGDLKVSLMMDYMDTDGQNREITEDAQTGLDKAFGTHASLAPGPVSLSEKTLGLLLDAEKGKWRIRGSFQSQSNQGLGEGIAQALDPNGRISGNRTTADLTYHEPKLSDTWDLTSTLAYYHGDQEVDKNAILFPPGANLGQGAFPNGVMGNPEFWERQIRFDSFAFYTGFEKHKIRIGTGYFFGHIYRVNESSNFTSNFAPRPAFTDVSHTPDAFLPENSRYDIYAYAQDEWRLFDNWELTSGIRYDDYSDFGNTVNPRAALVWKTTPDLTTKILYGQAFRAPNFAELYTKNNPVLIGNPSLKPETIRVYELACSYQFTQAWYGSLNLFHYDIHDLITFLKDPISTATAKNYGNQNGNGFEFETQLKASASLLFTGNYAFVNATNKNAGKPAGNYPSHKVYARGNFAFLPNWNLGSQLIWIGTRDREPADTRVKLKGYTTVDLILRRIALLEKFNLTAAIRNLFNADVREPSIGPGPPTQAASIPNDLPQAGRSAYLELDYRF